MPTDWKIGRVGSTDLQNTSKTWENKTVVFHEYWENDGSAWEADYTWTFTGRAVTRDSD